MNQVFIMSICLLLSGGVSSDLFAGSRSAKEIVKRVQKKYSELKTLQADFEQIFVWDLADETQTVKGKIYVNHGNKYRIDTDTQSIVTDGTTVWTYSKDRDQVIIDTVAKSEDTLPTNLLFRYSEDYKPIFRGEELLDGRKSYVIYLEPKGEDGLIQSMTLWVDASSWLTTKVEQIDINENISTYIVRNVQEDIELPPSLFKFSPTGDMEVVDLRTGE